MASRAVLVYNFDKMLSLPVSCKVIYTFIPFQYLAGYFDTTVGAKTEKDSYSKIVGKVDASAGEVLFLTDVSRG